MGQWDNQSILPDLHGSHLKDLLKDLLKDFYTALLI